jgi:hypothetical protein
VTTAKPFVLKSFVILNVAEHSKPNCVTCGNCVFEDIFPRGPQVPVCAKTTSPLCGQYLMDPAKQVCSQHVPRMATSEIVALARKRLHKTLFARTIFERLLHGDIEKLLWRAFGLALALHLIWNVVREILKGISHGNV